MRIVLIAAALMMLQGCSPEDRKHKYILTNKGPTKGWMVCNLGVLLTGDYINVRDENDNPIACTGYAMLTISEAENYEQK